MQKDTKFLMSTLPESLEKTEDGKILATLKNNETGATYTETYDVVISATGRDPDVSQIGLENLKGVTFNHKKIIRNENYEISEGKNVFVIGDIASDGLELTPVAIREGQILAERLFSKEKLVRKINYNIVPTTIFTPLEYSCCGLSEEKAIEKYGENRVVVFDQSFKPLEWTLSLIHI